MVSQLFGNESDLGALALRMGFAKVSYLGLGKVERVRPVELMMTEANCVPGGKAFKLVDGGTDAMRMICHNVRVLSVRATALSRRKKGGSDLMKPILEACLL